MASCWHPSPSSGTDIRKLRFGHEQQKIRYGTKHFRQALEVPFFLAARSEDIVAAAID